LIGLTFNFVFSRFYFHVGVTGKAELNDKVKEQYQSKMSNRFAALETLDDNVDVKWAWEGITENTPWFVEQHSKSKGAS
jgi:hypothetical protein